MEVHHHTHHPKKWKEYFWEFFMLFLAVFCGFLAELQLEHYVEHQRERQYMVSMLEDLKSDTAMLSNNIQERLERVAMCDSLTLYFDKQIDQTLTGRVYFYARTASIPCNLFPSDRTVQQLKNSGNLRLIRNQAISNNIMLYDQNLRGANFEMSDEQFVRAAYRNAVVKIFKGSVLNTMVRDKWVYPPAGNPPLYNTHPDNINELLGTAQYIKRINQAQLQKSTTLLQQATELIKQIETAYTIN
ncbi:MAG TPA: hypothetical protein V6C58_13650 [Allocoleopsis sp.]